MRLSWPYGFARAVAVTVPLIAALLSAGCSNTGRFAGPSWNLTGGKGSAPLPPQPVYQQQPQAAGLPASARHAPSYQNGRDPITGRTPGFGSPQHGMDARPLPPPTQPQQSQPRPAQPPAYRPGPASGTATPLQHRMVEVRPGQSLAAIAGEQRVSIAALMQANGLRDPYVIPGQQLIIPR
jgi:hypothetical protein